MEKNMKQLFWEELRKKNKGEDILVAEITKKLDANLAYISHLIRLSKDAGFLGIAAHGAFIVIKIPKDYLAFNKIVVEKEKEYRESLESPGRITKRRTGTISKLIKDGKLEITEEAIVPVILGIVDRIKTLTEENTKLRRIYVNQKKEIIRLEETLKEFEGADFE